MQHKMHLLWGNSPIVSELVFFYLSKFIVIMQPDSVPKLQVYKVYIYK